MQECNNTVQTEEIPLGEESLDAATDDSFFSDFSLQLSTDAIEISSSMSDMFNLEEEKLDCKDGDDTLNDSDWMKNSQESDNVLTDSSLPTLDG